MKKKLIFYVAWSIGAVLLMYLSNMYYDFELRKVADSLNVIYGLWATVVISFILGIYFATINGIPIRIKINRGKLILSGILIVIIMCYLSGFYYGFALTAYLERIFKNHGLFFVGVISGFTLYKGLFISKSDH